MNRECTIFTHGHEICLIVSIRTILEKFGAKVTNLINGFLVFKYPFKIAILTMPSVQYEIPVFHDSIHNSKK